MKKTAVGRRSLAVRKSAPQLSACGARFAHFLELSPEDIKAVRSATEQLAMGLEEDHVASCQQCYAIAEKLLDLETVVGVGGVAVIVVKGGAQ